MVRSGRMRRRTPTIPFHLALAISALLMPPLLFSRTVIADSNGWKIVADTSRSRLQFSHTGVGTILTDVRLSSADEKQPTTMWQVDKPDGSTIHVRTSQPAADWRFRIEGDVFKLSSTAPLAQLSGRAPAPKDRLVVRTIDREGAPVTWEGTEEVQATYHGSLTQHQSYLPRHNPDVMYFSLGQVSGEGFHSLFDRTSDTAIDFPETSVMRRDESDPYTLLITLPLSQQQSTIRNTPDYYKKLGLPFYQAFDETYFPRPPVSWSSWTAYYSRVTESDIVQNTDWLAEHLKPYGFEYVQLDDGYERGPNGEHTWIDKWNGETFPHGPEWLTDHIRSKGLHAGLWLVPNAYAGAVRDHPDWYVRDKQGNLILDYKTPALDSTNPQVQAFLKKLFTTLDGWGFDYYKFDGEHALPAYVPALDHSKLYDSAIDPVSAYRKRLQLIRGVIGPKVFLELCPAGAPLNGIGYANSYFNGQDVYNSWQGMFPMFASINANAFLNHVVTYLMPGEGIDIAPYMTYQEATLKRNSEFLDVVKSRERKSAGFGTTLAEAHTLVSYVALTGVAYPLASIMPELPEERVRLLKMSLPTMPIYPVDLFSRGADMRWDTFKHTTADTYRQTFPEILDLKVNAAAGQYDVIAVTNWQNKPAAKVINLHEKLGLPEGDYVVFDYWNQKLLGAFQNLLDVDSPPHDTRVLLVHRVQNHPQLVGTSRHITGAFSISELKWNAFAENTLSGTSTTVPGEPYRMFFYLPAGVHAQTVNALDSEGRAVSVEMHAGERSLEVSLQGEEGPIRWLIHFQ